VEKVGFSTEVAQLTDKESKSGASSSHLSCQTGRGHLRIRLSTRKIREEAERGSPSVV
jgi:hypothetical protein